MRILYLHMFPLWGSGSGTYARHLAYEVGKNHEVALLCPDKRTIENVKLFHLSLPFKVALTGHPEWPDCKLYSDISNREIGQLFCSMLADTVRVVESFRPEIIHVHHIFPLSWIANYIRNIYKINFITTVHGSELPTLERNKRYWQMTSDAMIGARRIVPNSHWTRDWFLKIFKGFYHEKCRVIPGGVQISKFIHDPQGAEEVDKKLNLHHKPVVLFAGKITKYKGVEYLINAASKIHGEIIILGDGPEKANLQKKAEKMRVKNVHWVGHLGAGVEKLVPYYSRADVFVAPSIWDEPLGLVILEAMACKTPVVVTRKGGIPLAVKEGVNGFFVRPRNSTQIVQKVNKLLDDENRRKKMGQKAREIVEKKFAWTIIAHRFELIYERFALKNHNK